MSQKNKLLKIKKNIYDGLEKNIYGFKNGILPLFKKDDMKTDSGDQKPDILDTSEETKSNDFLKQVKEEQRDMDMDLFGEQFGYKTPDEMLQTFKNLKNRADNNFSEANLTEYSSERFGNRVKKMTENVYKNEGKKILRIINKIFDFNFSEQKQKGQGIKILILNQMLSRLPIYLAQLKAGNNSEKLKNEIKQLLYSLCRSKKLTKNICKSLIDII